MKKIVTILSVLTLGTVAAGCACFNAPVGGHYILCSAEVNGYADGGDSGGPVYVAPSPSNPVAPWPAGIFHTYLTPSRTVWWFSSVSMMGTALGGAYSF